MDLYDGVDLELATVRNNLIADPLVLRMTDQSDQDPDFEIYTRKNSVSNGILQENILWEPHIKPYQIRDVVIELDLDKLPEDCGFLPIPIDKIGLLR